MRQVRFSSTSSSVNRIVHGRADDQNEHTDDDVSGYALAFLLLKAGRLRGDHCSFDGHASAQPLIDAQTDA